MMESPVRAVMLRDASARADRIQTGLLFGGKASSAATVFLPEKNSAKCRKPNEIKEFPVVFMLKTWYNMG